MYVAAFCCSLLCKAWDYSSLGTDWASPDSGYPNCAGERQSPINIISNDAISTNDLPTLRKTCGKIEGKFKNDGGHTLKFETLDGNPWVSQKEYLSGGPLGTDKYHFLQFHLHWGSSECDGSEHTIDEHRFPAELHFVHVKQDYIYIDGSIDQRAFTSGDGLAVLSIFVKGGATANGFFSQWFQPIAEAAKEIADSGDHTTIVQPKTIDLNQMAQRINPTFSGEFNYWTYNGSLTTPTCDESVVFIVAEKAIEVMDEQLAELFELTTDDNTEKLVNNFRLTQPLNSRDVLYVNFNDDTSSDYESACTCNLIGTMDYDCTCDSNGDGQCICDAANGYTGIDCDECISPFVWDSNSRTCSPCEPGYYFTTGDPNSCTGKYIIDIVLTETKLKELLNQNVIAIPMEPLIAQAPVLMKLVNVVVTVANIVETSVMNALQDSV